MKVTRIKNEFGKVNLEKQPEITSDLLLCLKEFARIYRTEALRQMLILRDHSLRQGLSAS